MLKKNGNLYFGEFLDLKHLIRKSNHEETYLCPYCSDLTGNYDTTGKFYFNTIKQVGHCFKCSVIIISDALRTPELIRQQLETVPDEEKYQHQKLSLSKWTSPIKENLECLSYMTDTRGIYPEVLDKFGVLATRTPKLGVVFCNKIWKDGLSTVTDFLAIRNVNSYIRHTNLRDQVKPVLWGDYVDVNSVVLVEGTTSGLSIYQHLDGLVSPLVLLGKTISDLQLAQLKAIVSSKKVEKIYIAMDGGFAEAALKVANVVYKAIDHQEVFVCNLPWKKDPNNLNKREFKDVWNNKTYSFQPLAINILRYEMYGGYKRSNRRK